MTSSTFKVTHIIKWSCLVKCNFSSYRCAAADKISTETQGVARSLCKSWTSCMNRDCERVILDDSKFGCCSNYCVYSEQLHVLVAQHQSEADQGFGKRGLSGSLGDGSPPCRGIHGQISSSTFTIGRIAYRREGVFFPIENASLAGKGGWECAARAEYAIYDCLVCIWSRVCISWFQFGYSTVCIC